MSRNIYRIFLASVLSFVFFFSFFQTSQAGFFDWFRKNNSQSTQSTAAVVSSAKQYILSVSKSGSGVVTSDDGKINCGKQCKASFSANSKIVLKAEAGNNYKFDRWNGCDKISDGKCQTTLNKSKMIVVKFSSKKASSSSSSQKSSSKSSSSKSSSASSKPSSSKAFSSNQASKSSSSVSNPSSSSLGFSSSNSSSINSNELDKNVFIIEDDGTLVQSGNIVDVEAVSRKFYSLYPNKDNYDFLNIFTTFVDSSKPHVHYMVRNNVIGIGGGQSNLSSAFGSNKLLGVNFFNTTFTADELNSTERSIKLNLNVIDHELSHQWLMYIGKDFGLSDDGVHYSRWANTGFTRDNEEWVDTNGGFVWKDNQNSTLSIPDSNFFTKRGFSKLSLYLLGLIPSSDVPDLEVVVPKDPTDKISRTIAGTFKKVSVNDIIKKYGERNPSYQNSQKNFRMAYIILTQKNETPAQYQLNAINYIAQNYPSEWNFLTYGKSTINQE